MKTRVLLFNTLLIGGLILAACTRSATTETVPPTQAPANTADAGAGAGPKGDPTMDALSTQLFSGSTAVAGGGGLEGGQAATATASPIPGVTQAVVTATVAVPTLAPVITATPVPPVAAACASPYTVKQGDWIYKIARECKLDPQAIIAANAGINPNRLIVGQKLNLPGAAPAPTVAPGATATPVPPAATCTGTYTVKGGDNLFRIAFNCGFTTEQMAKRNNIAPPYRIVPGQVLNYP